MVPRLVADGWEVATSDLQYVDYVCDLSSATGPDELIAAVTDEHGPISALILSHAHDVESGILDTTAASFDARVAVNARASLLLIAAFARQVPQEGGAVVALTSDHTTGNLAYGASKGALDRIVISAARELGPQADLGERRQPWPHRHRLDGRRTLHRPDSSASSRSTGNPCRYRGDRFLPHLE